MRVVGYRKERPMTFFASADLLAEGCRFNDEAHLLPTGSRTFIRKGVYRFKTIEESERHKLDCVVECVVKAARERF